MLIGVFVETSIPFSIQKKDAIERSVTGKMILLILISSLIIIFFSVSLYATVISLGNLKFLDGSSQK